MMTEQRGEAVVAMLVMMVVFMGVLFWRAGGMHDGNHGGHMSARSPTVTELAPSHESLDKAYERGELHRDDYSRKREELLVR